MLLYNEIIKSINNLFESNITTKTISDETGLSYTCVNELRNHKRAIFKTSLENCNSLYNLSISHGLNQKAVDLKKRKGRYDSIDLKLSVDKVAVSFEKLDLFALGIMNITDREYEIKKNRLTPLRLSKSVFITETNEYYDTYEFNERFNCGYGGGGPNNLADFIIRYSKINENEIKKTIFNNSIVIYDFKNDKIEGTSSILGSHGINLNMYNSKLIITLDKYDNIRDFNSSDKVNIKDSIVDIQLICSILNQYYNKNIELRKFIYVYDYKSNETEKYRNCDRGMLIRNSKCYRIILKFDEFEIWIPYFISEKNVSSNAEMKTFLNDLGVEIINKEQGFFSSFLSEKNSHSFEFDIK